jgi:molybdate transport system regulatory protein
MPPRPLPAAHLDQALAHHHTDKRIALLRLVQQTGSISQAARTAKVSYKAAWQALETLTGLAGVPLLEKLAGGTGGGGTGLTPAAHRLLDAAQALDHARHQALERLNLESEGSLTAAQLQGLAVRTSMRNQWACKVERLEPRGTQMLVSLRLGADPKPGPVIVSRITRESAQLLGLKPGLSLLALCKATALLIGPNQRTTSKANAVVVRSLRSQRVSAGDELVVRLSPSTMLVGIASQDLTLKPDDLLKARIEHSAVVIALAA